MHKAKFMETLRDFATKGSVTELADMLDDTDKMAASLDMPAQEVKRAIENAIIDGILVCNLNGDADKIMGLLWKENLSDDVLIEAIASCGDNGGTSPLAAFLDTRKLTDNVRRAVEAAICNAVRYRKKEEWPCIGVLSLIEREDLSSDFRTALKKLIVLPEDRTLCPKANPLEGDGVLSKGTVKSPSHPKLSARGREDKRLKR